MNTNVDDTFAVKRANLAYYRMSLGEIVKLELVVDKPPRKDKREQLKKDQKRVLKEWGVK